MRPMSRCGTASPPNGVSATASGILRDCGRSRSSIMTEADLQKQLDYLSGSRRKCSATRSKPSRNGRRRRSRYLAAIAAVVAKLVAKMAISLQPADLADNEADLAAIAARLGVAR